MSAMRSRRFFATVRFMFGAVTLIAVGTQLLIHISLGYNVLNFFSYFTNLSNLLAGVVLLVESVLTWRGKELGPGWQLLRCVSVVCMALVGIVFSALLRNVDLGSLLPWINSWLHFVMPVAVVLDWLIFSPRKPLALRGIGLMVLVPLAYLAYSLIRGAATSWYAYPFLNPAIGGYEAVTLTCLGIALAFLVVSFVLLVAGNKLRPLRPLDPARTG
ncbi:Pr6Pr family membrane protein [Arthrobacter cryoconiti]|nr:Pr6Pr family membrane protein [Arthrobacter cryoconiti]